MTRVTCLQLEPPGPGVSLQARAQFVAGEIRSCAGSDLIVLPELWPLGYFAFDRYADDAQPIPGELSEVIRDAAIAAGSHVVAGTILERAANGDLYNSSILIAPDGEILCVYRKVHTFGHGSREAQLVSPGDALCVAETSLGRVGLSVCYDLRFPELYRALVDGGAEILVVVASWPRARAGHWATLARTRAIENQAWLIACGAWGTDRGIELAGGSMVVSPNGEPIAEAGPGAARVDCRIELEQVHAYRRDFPALADRRLGRGTGDDCDPAPQLSTNRRSSNA